MVDIDSPILVQEPFLDQPTPKLNSKHPIKTILIFISFFIVLSLVIALTITILVGKKKQATSPYVSMITTSVGTITHASPTIITNASVTTTKYTSIITATYMSTTIASYTSLITIKSQATIATTSVDSTTTTMIISNTNESKSNGCQLPLIPNYNRNKVIVAGGDSPGLRLYELNKPIALALDSESNLFVADYNNYRVMKYAPNSRRGERVLGHGTDRYPRATFIVGLFINENDVLYTWQSNKFGWAIYQFIIWPSVSKNGTVLFNMTSAWIPTLTMDRNSNIYVLDGAQLSIYNAPTYEQLAIKDFATILMRPLIVPVSSSSSYVDHSSNFYLIDADSHQVLKVLWDDIAPERVLDKTPILLAFVVDCHNNLYTIDSNSSLIIYNSDGDVISTMHNAIDNPMDSESWPHPTRIGEKITLPDYFATLVVDSRNGDLYVAMYGYDRVTKFSLNK